MTKPILIQQIEDIVNNINTLNNKKIDSVELVDNNLIFKSGKKQIASINMNLNSFITLEQLEEIKPTLKGEKGDQGQIGEPGPKGEQGLPGEKGEPGTTDYNNLVNLPNLNKYYEFDMSLQAIGDANQFRVNGYRKTSIDTLNLPTGMQQWGVIQCVVENAELDNEAVFQIYYPIDGEYRGRMYQRSRVAGSWTEWKMLSTFSGNYNDLTNKPSIPSIPPSLPANGGNADTVGGYNIWVGTQSEYEQIGEMIDINTLYFIKEA